MDARDKNYRRYPRLPLRLECKVRSPDDPSHHEVSFDTCDVSVGGAFLRSDYLMEQGERLHLSFELPGGGSVQTQATVVWVTKAVRGSSAPGMGVEFAEIPDSQRSELVEYLRSYSRTLTVH